MVYINGSGWRHCNFISTVNATFQHEKCLALSEKWTMFTVRPSNSGYMRIVGRQLSSHRCSRLYLGHLLRNLRALPTICVHPELDGRTLDIVHSFEKITQFWLNGWDKYSFQVIQCRRRLIQCKEVTNQTLWLANNQRNSQINNQVRTLDVTTFGYAENLRAKQWPEYQVGFLRRRNNNTAAEKQL